MNIKRFVEELARADREGCVLYPYCDRKGLPTVGIGNLLANADAASAMPFLHAVTGKEATDDEKRFGWSRVAAAFRPGETAGFYRLATTLRLPREFAFELAAGRIEREFIPGILSLCHGFDLWPEQAQHAIVDMAYSLGIHGLASFVNMIGACQGWDFDVAARECIRHGARESRNEWTARMFREAAQIEKGKS
jgi:hypothetical protein